MIQSVICDLESIVAPHRSILHLMKGAELASPFGLALSGPEQLPPTPTTLPSDQMTSVQAVTVVHDEHGSPASLVSLRHPEAARLAHDVNQTSWHHGEP
jgi:hypothetical protein